MWLWLRILWPPKQTYENENENENRFRNRGKTTSVDTRKRETQTVKLNLVVFGFDTFPRKKPLVWTFGFENCKAWTNQRAVCCTTWLRVVSRDTEVGFVPGSCWILDQNLQKLSVVCSKEHGFRRTKTVFETVGLSSPLVVQYSNYTTCQSISFYRECPIIGGVQGSENILIV